MDNLFLCRITKESTFAEYDEDADDADVLWIDAPSADAVSFEESPQILETRSASGGNIAGVSQAVRFGCGGRLQSYLRPSQAPKLIPWAFSPSGSPRKLQSWTVDYFDGVAPRRMLGCTVSVGKVGSRVGADWVMIDYQLIGHSLTTPDETFTETFTDPDPDLYPSDGIYTHQEALDHVLIGGVANVEYDAIDVTATNRLYAPYRGDRRISRISYKGRDVVVTLNPLTASNALRDAWHDQARLALAISWVRTPHSVAFDFQAANYVKPFSRKRDFDSDDEDQVTFKANRDPATGLDMVAAVA